MFRLVMPMSRADADSVYSFLLGIGVGLLSCIAAFAIGGTDGLLALTYAGYGLAVVGVVVLLLFGPSLTSVVGGSDE